MSTIIGGVATSHVPAIGAALARGRQEEPYFRPFFEGAAQARDWVRLAKPDAVVVLYNDHGLNFFLDKMPTFAIGAAESYRNEDEGWGLPVTAPFRGDPRLSWHIIEQLVEGEFDITSCQSMAVDHAFAIPMKLLWPEGDAPPAVPIAINTVQHPLPSVARCFRLGQALGAAIRSFPGQGRVLVLATGGLSHQLDGARAGFINKAFDLQFLDELVAAPASLIRHSIMDLVREAGTQGVEALMWVAMRAALGDHVREVHRAYHIPISNTAACTLVVEPVLAEITEARRVGAAR
jgi:protocatechuate 4,5-dioxygenase beta chain